MRSVDLIETRRCQRDLQCVGDVISSQHACTGARNDPENHQLSGPDEGGFTV